MSQCLLSLAPVKLRNIQEHGVGVLIDQCEPATVPEMHSSGVRGIDTYFCPQCKLLSALVHEPDMTSYSSHIMKLAQSLCTAWWNATDHIHDKWVSTRVFMGH